MDLLLAIPERLELTLRCASFPKNAEIASLSSPTRTEIDRNEDRNGEMAESGRSFRKGATLPP